MCRLRAAEAHAAHGEREAAGAAAASSLATAEELGSAWLASEVAGLIARARLPTGTAAEDPAGDGVGRPGAEDDPFGLTPRERQVLAALAEGATNREIAASLFMAEKTASVHVSRILTKLGVRSRTEAAAVAHRLNLAQPDR
jgi:DNA-binding NarL/FixJ family response regulator